MNKVFSICQPPMKQYFEFSQGISGIASEVFPISARGNDCMFKYIPNLIFQAKTAFLSQHCRGNIIVVARDQRAGDAKRLGFLQSKKKHFCTIPLISG
ncbi:MAG: hypothetical protein PUE61_08560 [Clostridiales bacterium]|nr:hypothetical protein [Clostridiales bacterium]